MRLVPYVEHQYKILQYIGNSKFFYYFYAVFLLLHYMSKRPNINLISLVSMYLLNDIDKIISLNCFASVIIFCIGNMKSRLKVPRPFWVFDDLPLKKQKMERTYSFPSGHTMMIAGSFLSLLMTKTYSSITLFFIIAVSMPISRLYLCVHWVSDVVFSLLFSFVMSVSWYFINPLSYTAHDEISTVLSSFVLNMCIILSFVYYGIVGNKDDVVELKTHTLISYSLSCIGYFCVILGIFINWNLEYVEYPNVYNNFGNMYITIMFYLAVLKIMDIVINAFDLTIEKYPILLYIIRFVSYFIGIVGGLVIPNVIM